MLPSLNDKDKNENCFDACIACNATSLNICSMNLLYTNDQ